MDPVRTLLFVPAHRDRMIEKAPDAGADGLLYDLEDSVPVDDRNTARQMLADALTAPRSLPRYIRDKKGVIENDLGVFHLPDSRAAGTGDQAQHMYTVRFDAREVWGVEAPANDSLRITLWDDYMNPA